MANTSSSFAPNNDLTNVEALLQQIEDNTDSLEVNTDTLESLVTDTNTKLDTLILQQDKELVYTPAVKANNWTINLYTREAVVYDSETATEVSRVTEYSIDGNTWSTTAPAWAIVIGRYSTPVVTPVYNTQEHFEVNTFNSPFTLSVWSSVPHSLSYTIIEWTADVDIGWNTISNLPEWFSQTYTATNTLSEDMTFTTAGRVIINIVR